MFKFLFAGLLASTFAKLELSDSRIQGVDDLGLNIHQSSFGANLELENDANVQYTFYTTTEGTSITPDRATISFIDKSSGNYWEDTVGIRQSDGRGRFALRTAQFPLKSADGLDIKLFVAKDQDTAVFDIGRLTFSKELAASVIKSDDSFGALPEIAHTFKAEVEHTPAVVSGVATILINGIPWLLFAILLSFLKFDLKPNTTNTAFICTLLAFEGLLIKYWVSLTLFQFIPFAIVNGLAVFVSGNKALKVLKKRRTTM